MTNALTKTTQLSYSGGDLVQITYADTSTVVYTFDTGNRLTKIVDSVNGTIINVYDKQGRLTAITYKNANGTVLGDLIYTYDAAGQRIKTSGSLARTTLPADATSTVDVANRLSTWASKTLSYDANGNLIGDGTTTYTWNARNQLIQISGASTASFTYDALGRRLTKTVNGVATGFVYDGLNIAQELNGVATTNATAANVRATYLMGGIDEVFAQQTGTAPSAQTLNYLTDALGSTIRLTNAAGAKVVDYTDEPYGGTTADATINNPFQYTARENDGNGLYYYRARYYSPAMQRFISEDPIGLLGGINMHAYVGGNPISWSDPMGLVGLATSFPHVSGWPRPSTPSASGNGRLGEVLREMNPKNWSPQTKCEVACDLIVGAPCKGVAYACSPYITPYGGVAVYLGCNYLVHKYCVADCEGVRNNPPPNFDDLPPLYP